MIKLRQKENESRKDYLLRVVVLMLEHNAHFMEYIEYDDTECDAFCLAEDLRNEFDITDV